MRFHVMTLFPDMIEAAANTSVLGRAIGAGLIGLKTWNIRDYSKEKHKHVDDYPYGGGKGMLMMAEPVCGCFDAILRDTGRKPRVLYMSPAGRTLDQAFVRELAQEEELVLLCGHYEGIDERAIEELEAEEVSIGDYVLTGGELPALVVMDAVARQVTGVLSDGSADVESFSDGLLEFPQYTRPEEYRGRRVPQILLSGDHGKVDEWRRFEALKRTYARRPDLLEK
ncbi:MAG: tRNA (guanosine(37)-N1)-methyltransferase TrmD, partial [Lachnospiraceae bacterium]|nr:tRNA (guanosine(37)-N1)-methyltransferase TrmD [Lachnospiraceae bacterium]